MEGITNFDTSKMVLLIANVRDNYLKVKENKQKLLNMNNKEFISFIKTLKTLGDKINYNNISVTEIKKYISNME